VIRPGLAVALLVAGLAVAAGWGLYRHGVQVGRAAEAAEWQAARDKLQRDLFALADRHSEAARELDALRADQDQLLREFENALAADASACRAGDDSLRRLETLWGRARAKP
jgi:hypothetical protein